MYKNIERLQIAKGPKHFNFVPKTFMIPNEYSEFAATHHRMRGGRSSFKSVSSSIHPIHPSTHYRMRGGTRFLKSSKLFFSSQFTNACYQLHLCTIHKSSGLLVVKVWGGKLCCSKLANCSKNIFHFLCWKTKVNSKRYKSKVYSCSGKKRFSLICSDL